MRVLYLDCFSGISGDMCLGALIDAGADGTALAGQLRLLSLEGWEMSIKKAQSHGISGTRVNIKVQEDHQPHRHFQHIKKIIEDAPLPAPARDGSLAVFQRLAEAEGKVHGVPADQVHFHEVGAVDSIIDIVGTCLALYQLGVEWVECSPLPTGRGFVKCRHGLLPVPAPATAQLLVGVPLGGPDVEGELVTPTGAAITTTLSAAFGPRPDMTVEAVGYGLGSRDYGIPNFLRVFVGNSSSGKEELYNRDKVIVMETDIDDMNPEFLGHVMEKLFQGDALDVSASPSYMKKCRPGYRLTILCRPQSQDSLLKLLFEETTTLGVRCREEERAVLERKIGQVNTPYGTVRVKLALDGAGLAFKAAPEYEDCRKIAREKNIPLMVVYNSALAAADEMLL